jgi:outer membrane protein assembly factor BamE (lipoprotein component of BamABCDE complex)
MTKTLAAAAAALLLSGCYFGKTKEDQTWDRTVLAKLEIGKSSKADVLRLLGSPRQVVRLLDSEAYMYSHSIEKRTNTFLVLVNLQRTDRQYDAITVIIGRDGLVQGVGSRFAADDASYGMPWGD